MFELKALQVAHGDALLVSYGEYKVRHILVDGGPASKFSSVISVLEDLKVDGAMRLELLVVSHYDLDHIGGVLELFKAKPSWLSIGEVWFNGREHCVPKDALGTGESDELSRMLSGQAYWNTTFLGGPVLANPDCWIGLEGGLEILVLSPTKHELEVVGREWGQDDRKSSTTEPADSLGRKDTWPAPAFSSVKRKGLGVDSSAANGSSIALLLKYETTKIVLSADAFPRVIVETLGALPEQPVELAVLQLSHHGSQGNTSNALLEAVSCNNFLITTDSSIHRHPDQTLFARILDQKVNPEFNFNYEHPHASHWKTPPKGWPNYSCRFPQWDERFVRIKLLSRR